MFKKNRIIIFITPFLISLTLTGCFSHNIGNKFNDPLNAYLKVFVTSSGDFGDFTAFKTTYNVECGSLSGIDAANCICSEFAKSSIENIYSGREYRAWLSTTTIDARCNILGQDSNADDCGITLVDGDGYGPWLKVGTYQTIFSSYNDVIGYSLKNNLDNDENGNTVGVAPFIVWTGTGSDGKLSSGGSTDTCGDWTIGVGGPSGLVGNVAFTGSTWTDNTINGCANSARIYCFEQPDL